MPDGGAFNLTDNNNGTAFLVSLNLILKHRLYHE